MKKYIYICITESFCYTAEVTQHSKSTILQDKKEKKRGGSSVWGGGQINCSGALGNCVSFLRHYTRLGYIFLLWYECPLTMYCSQVTW